MQKVLVTGWFSFEQMGATAGDLLVRDVACKWLQDAGRRFDVALAPPFEGGVDWRTIDPTKYSEVIFACGPFRNCEPVDALFHRFKHAGFYGVNLSMLDSVVENGEAPFVRLWERDSDREARPDLAFLAPPDRCPVAGLVLVQPQKEYGNRGRHAEVKDAFRRLAATREMAIIPIDTRLDENRTGLRTCAEVESVIAKMDLLLTTRLHGTVFALRNGVPPLVVDPIVGGAKVARHARTVGWPVVFTADEISDARLVEALDYCLTQEAREKAKACYAQAESLLAGTRSEFIDTFMKAPVCSGSKKAG